MCRSAIVFKKRKWKTTTKWLSKSSSLIFQIPEDETFGNQTILFQGTNSDLDINYSLENNIKNYKNPNKYDSTKIFTMLDSFNIKGKNGVLFKLENSFDYNKSKPISYLIYMEKTSNSVTECSIRIYEKFLSNKFIKEWSLVLKNFKLKSEYYEGE